MARDRRLEKVIQKVGVLGVEHLSGREVLDGGDSDSVARGATRVKSVVRICVDTGFDVSRIFNEAVLLRVLFRDRLRVLVQLAQVLGQSHVDEVHVLRVEVLHPVADVDDLLQDVLALVLEAGWCLTLLVQLLLDDFHN